MPHLEPKGTQENNPFDPPELGISNNSIRLMRVIDRLPPGDYMIKLEKEKKGGQFDYEISITDRIRTGKADEEN